MTQPPVGVPVCYRHPDRETHIRCQRCERPICPECMVPAAVGFQCPECVREGSKGVRQARNIRLRGGSDAIVTWTLIGINVAVFLVIQGLSAPALYDLMIHAKGFCTLQGHTGVADHAMCAAQGGTFSPGVADGGYWELLTSVFAHQQIWHIASNMLSLFMIGPLLESALGRGRYLATYLLCGLGGSALAYWAASPYTPGLGASGAIFGLLGALFVLFLRRGLPMQQLLFVLALNFYITFSVANISWQAHVGGFITGLAIGSIFEFSRGRRDGERLRLAGLGAVAATIVVAVLARSLTL